jgi:hypothetical protein
LIGFFLREQRHRQQGRGSHDHGRNGVKRFSGIH